jgi:hypothetical protein
MFNSYINLAYAVGLSVEMFMKTVDRQVEEIERVSHCGVNSCRHKLPRGFRFIKRKGLEADDAYDPNDGDDESRFSTRFHFMTADEVVDTGNQLDPFDISSPRTPVSAIENRDLVRLLRGARRYGKIIDPEAYQELNDDERDKVTETLGVHEDLMAMNGKDPESSARLRRIASQTGVPARKLERNFPSLANAA